MSASSLDLSLLTLDDIVNAMRINGIRQIKLDTKESGKKVDDPYVANVVEWYGATTKVVDGSLVSPFFRSS